MENNSEAECPDGQKPWMKYFDMAFGPYRGVVDSLEKFEKVREAFETSTTCSFISQRTSQTFGRAGNP